MSASKETHQVFQTIRDRERALSIEDFLRLFETPLPYNRMKEAIYALAAYCFERLNISSHVEENLEILPDNECFVLHTTPHPGESINRFVSITSNGKYALETSRNTALLRTYHLAQPHSTFYEKVFVAGFPVPMDQSKVESNLSYAKALSSFCGNIYAQTVSDQESLILDLLQTDWRFQLLEQILTSPDSSDDVLVEILANETDRDFQKLKAHFGSAHLLENPWIIEYFKLLEVGDISDRVAHLNLVFDPQDTFHSELRSKIRNLFPKDRRDTNVVRYLQRGTQTAGIGCSSTLRHQVEYAYGKLQLKNEAFCAELRIKLKESGLFSDDEIDEQVCEFVKIFGGAHEHVHGEKGAKLFKIYRVFKSLVKQKSEDDPEFQKLVLTRVKFIEAPAVQLAKETHVGSAKTGVELFADEAVGFELHSMNADGRFYKPKIINPFTRTATAQIGCVNIFSGTTHDFIHLYQRIMSATAPSVLEAGGRLI